MTVHHITSGEANWTRKLADLLDTATEEDIIIVSSDAMRELAENALGRRTDGKQVLVMTMQTYAAALETAAESLAKEGTVAPDQSDLPSTNAYLDRLHKGQPS